MWGSCSYSVFNFLNRNFITGWKCFPLAKNVLNLQANDVIGSCDLLTQPTKQDSGDRRMESTDMSQVQLTRTYSTRSVNEPQHVSQMLWSSHRLNWSHSSKYWQSASVLYWYRSNSVLLFQIPVLHRLKASTCAQICIGIESKYNRVSGWFSIHR